MRERRIAFAYIKRAILAVDEELKKKDLDLTGPASRIQLIGVKEELLDMLESMETQNFLNNVSGMGKMIIDSWPINDPLGEVILAAEQAYLEFLSVWRKRRR